MRLFSSAIALCRYFCTTTTGKSTKWSQIRDNKRNKRNNHSLVLAAISRSESVTGFAGSGKMSNPTTPTSTGIKWTDEQLQVLAAISRGESVFVTGSAGTGKTILVHHIIELLENIHGPLQVSVTASTGVAACALEGQTLHSFAGVGLAAADSRTLLNRVLCNDEAYKRWNRVKALVIDEISMVQAEFFDKLEYIAREARDKQHASKNKVWGGIQLVVSGDFFQLPPILDKQELKRGKEFAFEADCWNSSFDVQVELTKIFRQSDGQLIKLLQGIRRGKCDPEGLKLLKQCNLETEPDSSVVRFYPRNKDVNRVNEEQLVSLGVDIVEYCAIDRGKNPWKQQLKQGISRDTLEVCEGARVMLCKNIDVGLKLVNGSTGTVVGFHPKKDKDVTKLCWKGLLPVVNFDSGPEMVIYPEKWLVMEGEEVRATRKQIPLILAWAVSVHKCQGMTLDSLHTNLSRAFGFGMVYVALSRVRSLAGLHVSGFNPSKVKAHPKVLQFYQSFTGKQDKQEEDDYQSFAGKQDEDDVAIAPAI
ncbi:ATP-dependent DNA helicase pfh1-like [Cornus florida]|uniref:ATP-dependent DNA helicase pfh1-like n=1 Tax=Cornus florida TaxID=4283 RepID=UPI00289C8E1A|nr:ATP-dependent DNA helicase pfh1-like [Cornus florida]